MIRVTQQACDTAITVGRFYWECADLAAAIGDAEGAAAYRKVAIRCYNRIVWGV